MDTTQVAPRTHSINVTPTPISTPTPIPDTNSVPATDCLVGAASVIPAAPVDSAARDPDSLAALLAQSPPTCGPLDELEFDRLSPAGRINAVLAWEHLVRHAHAGLIRCLGTLARDAGDPRRITHDGADSRWLIETELSAALAWSPATTQNRLSDAYALVRLFPQTLQQLTEGHVSLEQARCLAQLTSGLTDEAAQATEARVLARMPGQSPAVTRQAIRRAILRADPDAAAQRHRYERARRRVELRPEDDGMATLSFYLPADVAQMAMRTLTEMAQRAKRKNKNKNSSDKCNLDERTLDQRRADLLPALLHGATTGVASNPVIPAQVSVVVGIETLLGLSHEPGHLDGYGPICPEQTRRIAHAHAARWRFLLTASDGTLAQISPRTYSPAAALKHLTRLKHRTCAFPHCAMPADRCDLDHGHAFHKGGSTTADNLAPLCRSHHNGKSFGHWELNRHGENIHWTSALTGLSYTTAPTRYGLTA